MIILEVSNTSPIDSFANVQPFIHEVRPGRVTFADWWMDVVGLPDESRDYTIIVQSFIRDLTEQYSEVISFSDLEIQEGSFYWDNTNQILYVHFEHEYEGWNASYLYGSFWGFCEKDVTYLDNQQYSPLLLGSPSVAQSQDILNYDKPAFMSGNATISNGEMMVKGKPTGVSDNFITANVYNNDVYLYYYPDKKLDKFGNGDRDNLVRLGAFYIEDYTISLKKIIFKLQDKRKAQDITIPTELFTTADYPNFGDVEDAVIPLMYGQVREAKAIPVNSDLTTGDVEYRAALILTDFGTVQVDIDGIWTTVTPTSSTLATGEFSISATNGRDTSGAVRDCKLLEPIGIVISKTSDIIIDLNERYLGLPFLDSFYNTTEWDSETASLSSGGYVFDKEIDLWDAITIVQNGSLVGFRYEIAPDGRRTIRLDDPSRVTTGRITNNVMLNRDDLPVASNHKEVFANIKIKYSQSFNSGYFLSTKNSNYAQSVLEKFKSQNTLTTETVLNNSTDAEARALSDAEKFSEISKVSSIVLMGEEFLDLRIFDTKQLELCTGFTDADTLTIDGRDYYGFVDGKIISINPDPETLTNKVKFLLLED